MIRRRSYECLDLWVWVRVFDVVESNLENDGKGLVKRAYLEWFCGRWGGCGEIVLQF